jgi:trehalose 6-phosphate phosphatase
VSAVDDAVERTLAVLAARPSLLVTDVDGTLSRIVPRPDQATVSERAQTALRVLQRKLDHVAVITGREQAVARRMVGVEGLIYIGSYALDGANDIGFEAVRPALAQIEPRLAALPGVELELKQVSFALHYRNSPEAEHMGPRLLALLAPIAERTATRLLEGKQVIEVAPGFLPDKGAALLQVVADRRIRGVVFVGDDLADAAAFREISRRRESSGEPGLSIAVVDDETPPSVRESADLAVNGVDDVERVLELLAQRVS